MSARAVLMELLRDVRAHLAERLHEEINSYTNTPGIPDLAFKRRNVPDDDCGDIPELEALVDRVDAQIRSRCALCRRSGGICEPEHPGCEAVA